MNIPSSTYRLQLNDQFRFSDLEKIIGYLDKLGISTIYAAPIFKATEGSNHGYDVIDPHMINPEIGTEEQLAGLSKMLKDKNMDWLQDIVPNHMAYATSNERLSDVMERGKHSEFRDYFDIDWHHPDPELSGKLLTPFLGGELNECIQEDEIKLVLDGNGLSIGYADTFYPVSISAYQFILDYASQLPSADKTEIFRRGITNLYEKASSDIPYKEWLMHKHGWVQSILNDLPLKQLIDQLISGINSDKELLKTLISRQDYILSFWRTTEKKISYRRFFTVNSLICLAMENQEVFDEYHQYIYSLYNKGYVHGLRIDHIDGLNDPKTYIDRLRSLCGENCYIIAEKILEANENIPEDWDLQGTSGYEFLSYISRVLTDKSGAKELLEFYRQFTRETTEYEDLVFSKKMLILHEHMQGELDNLVHLLDKLQLIPREPGTENNIREAMGILMAAFPVYRIYPDTFPIEGMEFVNQAFEKAANKAPHLQAELKQLCTLFNDTHVSTDESANRILFLRRLMQYTGPLAAKGVEDTTFYIYNPLISHNEVGDAPNTLAITTDEFHDKMIWRQNNTPLSINATATHDTKRGEDARLRINVLSEMTDEWKEHVIGWREMNQSLKKIINGNETPSLNEEYFIYQSIIGGFPEDMEVDDEFTDRLKIYFNKVLREAKINTNWAEPDTEYEDACAAFIESLLNRNHSFLKSFLPFIERIIRYGSMYSLAQSLIRITAPGIPDTYQGCELWDLSYVDPDNRRPVDYGKRMKLLEGIIEIEHDKQRLLSFIEEQKHEGSEKIYVNYKALNFRKAHKELFISGEYVPVTTTASNQILAYARVWKNQWVIVVVPVGLVKRDQQQQAFPNDQSSIEFSLLLPANAPSSWINEFTGQEYIGINQLKLGNIFSDFPVALLRGK